MMPSPIAGSATKNTSGPTSWARAIAGKASAAITQQTMRAPRFISIQSPALKFSRCRIAEQRWSPPAAIDQARREKNHLTTDVAMTPYIGRRIRRSTRISKRAGILALYARARRNMGTGIQRASLLDRAAPHDFHAIRAAAVSAEIANKRPVRTALRIGPPTLNIRSVCST